MRMDLDAYRRSRNGKRGGRYIEKVDRPSPRRVARV